MLHTHHTRISSCRPTLIGLSLMACCQTLHGTTNLGPDWDGDSSNDAGAIPATAQRVEKDDATAVVIIRGELKGEEGRLRRRARLRR